MNADNVMGLAAQMSYYFALALFPFLIFLAAIVGSLPFTDLWEEILKWMTIYLPQGARTLVFETVISLTHGRESFLSLGLLGTAWAGSAGIMNLMHSLNVAYDVEETRSFFQRLVFSFLMLFVLVFFFLGSFGLLTLGAWLDRWLTMHAGLERRFIDASQMGRWLISLALLAVGTSLLDYALPNLKRPWKWLTPGTSFAVLACAPVTFAFNLYVTHLAAYDKTYGALAVFVILMVWIYLLSLLALVGAEINCELGKLRLEAQHALPSDAAG